MSEHIAQGYRNIAMDAALGKLVAYGPFLRMMSDAHMIFQPAKDEAAGAQERVPVPAQFIRSPQAPPITEPSAAAAERAPGVVSAEGQEYVAVG